MSNNKFTILDFGKKKKNGEKISMLTAYDYSMAKLIDAVGIDAVLVGDSVGMVMLGYDSTIPVTMDEMIHHAKAVKRGLENAFLIGDMPFMSYQENEEDAVKNAGRFVKEAGCQAVKLEGGREFASRIETIIAAGIPVIGHIGLTPQSVNKLGGYKVQGKDDEAAARLVEDAIILQDSGCSALILECVPAALAGKITEQLKIPTIGIGAGIHCDGQVLVTHDMIGCFDKFVPKFVKQYANVGKVMTEAVETFKNEVESGTFPSDEHSF